jgi:tetratricopeptide (TPR) repeat protein
MKISVLWGSAGQFIRRPLVLVVAVGLVAGTSLAWANVRLRGRPEDLTPVFIERLGDFGLVRLYGEESDFWPGNAAWADGHPETAIREWSKLVDKEGATQASLEALMNIGNVSFARGDRKQAVAAYTKAVELPVPKRPRTSPLDRWHNEKHQACAALSDIFLDLGNPQLAIKYAELACDPHGFSSPCGSANAGEDWAFETRIADLKTAIANRRPILVETPEQASLREFKRPLAVVQRAELKRLRHDR